MKMELRRISTLATTSMGFTTVLNMTMMEEDNGTMGEVIKKS